MVTYLPSTNTNPIFIRHVPRSIPLARILPLRGSPQLPLMRRDEQSRAEIAGKQDN